MAEDVAYDFAPSTLFPGEGSCEMEIGGTTYEVSTHFSADGRQSVLTQFMALIEQAQA